ncbi:hypothetical protein F2Q69_00047472 [Brassica cretica]|uniref:Uncharacterized protein n=1 Tax=Brassica cretica TaxID=69181 RepID=A0A8S9Q439_BRACR|nr:hypothetical protein F2Q69_00047472 [Brassica cretica]
MESSKKTGKAVKLALLRSGAASPAFPSVVNHGQTLNVKAVLGMEGSNVVCTCMVCKCMGSPSAQGVPDPSSNDLGLFNLSSQTRRSQTACGELATRSARWTARVPDLSNHTARVPISSSSRFISLVVHSTLLEVNVIRNLKENP